MIEFLTSTAAFIVAIALLIAVHEYGHFIVARKLGIRVEKFSVGFGPALASWRSRDGEVEYIIAAIPLGGYVKMLGENPGEQKGEATSALKPAELARAFHVQPVWKRAAVSFAGPLFNFIFAILAYMMIGWIGLQVTPPIVGHVNVDSLADRAGIQIGDVITHVNGKPVHAWQHVEEALKPAVGQEVRLDMDRDGRVFVAKLVLPLPEQDALLTDIGETLIGFSAGQRVFAQSVIKDSAADRGGLRDGDEILRVDHEAVDDVRMLIHYVQQHAGTAITLGVMRGDLQMNIPVTPQSDPATGQGRMGVVLSGRSMQAPVQYSMGAIEGVLYGFSQTWAMTSMTVEVLAKMVANTISPSNLGGPIAIAQMAGQTIEYGLIPYLLFLALISVNLGVLNLLPVPILDGGHLAYLSLEALRGRPLSPETMEKTQLVGVLLIACLMIYAFYNDIARFLHG